MKPSVCADTASGLFTRREEADSARQLTKPRTSIAEVISAITGHTIRMTRSTTSAVREESMIDKETYLNVLTRYFDSIREDSDESVPNCADVPCENCMFNNSDDACPQGYNVYNALKKLKEWSKKNHQKHKISKSEYRTLDNYLLYYNYEKEIKFGNSDALRELIKRGYFKGATNETNIREYLDGCEVVKE